MQIPDDIVALLEVQIPFVYEPAPPSDDVYTIDGQLSSAECQLRGLVDERKLFENLVAKQSETLGCMPYLRQLHAHMTHNIGQMEAELQRLREARDQLVNKMATKIGRCHHLIGRND